MAPLTTTVAAGTFIVISLGTYTGTNFATTTTPTMTSWSVYDSKTSFRGDYAAVPTCPVRSVVEKNLCRAAAVPPCQPPPVSLDMCAVPNARSVEGRADVAPQAAAWLRHAQSQTRERRPLRRRVRAWEA